MFLKLILIWNLYKLKAFWFSFCNIFNFITFTMKEQSHVYYKPYIVYYNQCYTPSTYDVFWPSVQCTILITHTDTHPTHHQTAYDTANWQFPEIDNTHRHSHFSLHRFVYGTWSKKSLQSIPLSENASTSLE